MVKYSSFLFNITYYVFFVFFVFFQLKERIRRRIENAKQKRESNTENGTIPTAISPTSSISSENTNSFKQRTRRATSPASIILDKQLDNDEIIADMYEINRDEQLYCSRMGLSLPSEGGVEPSSHRDSKRKTPLVRSFPEPGGSSKSEFVTVDLKIGEVKVGNDIYYKGECVGVSTSDSKKTQEVVGIIASVNNSEVSFIFSSPFFPMIIYYVLRELFTLSLM